MDVVFSSSEMIWRHEGFGDFCKQTGEISHAMDYSSRNGRLGHFDLGTQ